MGELIITDNPGAEVACLVDIDEYRPLSIVAVGENRMGYLQSFVDSSPFDVTVLDPLSLRDAFVSFLERQGGTEQADAQDNTSAQVEPSGGNGSDDGSALAEHEAVGVTDTPPPAPADTDEEAARSPQTVQVKCWNCNGEGVIRVDEEGESTPCNLCSGTGKVTQEVAA